MNTSRFMESGFIPFPNHGVCNYVVSEGEQHFLLFDIPEEDEVGGAIYDFSDTEIASIIIELVIFFFACIGMHTKRLIYI